MLTNTEELIASSRPEAAFELATRPDSPRVLFGKSIRVWLQNDTDKKTILAWVDYSGNYVPVAVLDPTRTLEIDTFAGHQWVAYQAFSQKNQICSAMSFTSCGYLLLSKVVDAFNRAMEDTTAPAEAAIQKFSQNRITFRKDFCDARYEDKIVPFNIHDSASISAKKKKSVMEPFIVSMRRARASMMSNSKVADVFLNETLESQYKRDEKPCDDKVVSIEVIDPKPDNNSRKGRVACSHRNDVSRTLHYMLKWVVDLLHWCIKETMFWIGYRHNMWLAGFSLEKVFTALLWTSAVLHATAIKDKETQTLDIKINSKLRKMLIIQLLNFLVVGPLSIYSMRPVREGGRFTKREAWKRVLLFGELSPRWQKLVHRITMAAWFFAFLGFLASAHCSYATGLQPPDPCTASSSGSSSTSSKCNVLELAFCCDSNARSTQFSASQASCGSTKTFPGVCEKEAKMSCMAGWILPVIGACLYVSELLMSSDLSCRESFVVLVMAVTWRPDMPKFYGEIRIKTYIERHFHPIWHIKILGVGPAFPIEMNTSEAKADKAVEEFMALREEVILSQAKEHCRGCAHSKHRLFGTTASNAAGIPSLDSSSFPERGRGTWKKNMFLKWRWFVNES
eukprot:764391-Hanusia_phi.AAC.1